ncbi:MAG: glycolate oxidase subunit GlcE [Gammaproteobacteria bacterium]|nr:glycolate oxidase subunit GlcE [Gammaproteobacteria bacterium]
MSVAKQYQRIQEVVQNAYEERTPLYISGSGSKQFYGRHIDAQKLDVSHYGGIVHYEPTELVITAAAGTPLKEIESALAKQNQMLPFEPPHFGDKATLGGCIATGLSGPRRPYSGAVRDYVLGLKLVNGKGELLHFGGEVMKNVAGYDVSRLMSGSLGTLGVLLEVSLKILPKPKVETTLIHPCSSGRAQELMIEYNQQPMPLSGTCHDGENLYVRLSGTQESIASARQFVRGDELPDGQDFWQSLKEHQLDFFKSEQTLWRLSLPATSKIDIKGDTMLDWGGAQRWIYTDVDGNTIREKVARENGHATQFRNADPAQEYFQPLPAKLRQLHMNLKLAFDPNCILNPSRMYSDF